VKWRKQGGYISTILRNSLEYDIYGDTNHLGKRDALEWICKNFGKPNTSNCYQAIESNGNQIDISYMCCPDSTDSFMKKTKYYGLNCDARIAVRASMEQKSLAVFSLMKIAGYPIRIYKRLNTDLSVKYNRDTVAKLLSTYEANKNEENIKGMTAFYFKEGSSYYLYTVSPKYFGEVSGIANDLGIKYKVIQ